MSAMTGWVDLSEMACPGCREQVSSEPPASEPGQDWSHRDGSPLCRPPTGGPGGRSRGRSTSDDRN